MDKDLFVQILVRDHDKLRAYTWQLVRDDSLVEEILQNLAVVALQKLDQIRDAEHFPAWARRTCRNLAMAARRKQGQRPLSLSNASLDLLESHWEKFDAVSSSELTNALRKCVARLTPHAQHILQMRYAEGIAASEIARRLGIKVTSVYVTLMRLHRSLAECIDRERVRGETFHG